MTEQRKKKRTKKEQTGNYDEPNIGGMKTGEKVKDKLHFETDSMQIG